MASIPKPVRLSLKKIGLIIKHHHPEAAALSAEMAEMILGKGLTVLYASESKHLAKELASSVSRKIRGAKSRIKIIDKAEMVDQADLIVVLGGDGTYLSIAGMIRSRSVPVLGVNMGQLGFLTEFKQSEAFDFLSALIAGQPAPMSSRSLLEVTLKRKNRVIFRGPAVNDAVISKGAIARVIGLDVTIDGRFVANMRGDGVIVATPTGSTAYNLAAGGPILDPSLPALVLSAICPHSLTQRPLVVPDSSEIAICLQHRPGHVYLTLDGQDAVDLEEGDIVLVRRFKKHSLKLISSPTRDYFSLLREKLKFGIRH